MHFFISLLMGVLAAVATASPQFGPPNFQFYGHTFEQSNPYTDYQQQPEPSSHPEHGGHSQSGGYPQPSGSGSGNPEPTGPPSGPPGGPPSGGGPPGGVVPGVSPSYDWVFEFPLPMPPVLEPKITTKYNNQTMKYYEITIEPFEHQVYPNLGPTHLVGYNGMSPGPTIQTQRGDETVLRVLNKGSGPAVVHLHGSPSHAPWDGWTDDSFEVGQFKDYYYPNTQAGPLWYHDHMDRATAPDVYFGQAGAYIIFDPEEDPLGLPMGDYDIPIVITDKSYKADGDLISPAGETEGFLGDIIQVNEQPWPYLNVEPRKYRFRLYNLGLSRAYELEFIDEWSGDMIEVQVIASEGGLFEHSVSTQSIAIAMAERYEVIMDFAPYKNSNITLANDFKNQEGLPQYPNTDKVMRFVVGDWVSSDENNGDIPETLNANINFPDSSVTELDHVFNFQQGGDAKWTINGYDFDDVNNRILAAPKQGSVELWEMHHGSGPGAIHPAHIHLVNFQILERTGGTRPALPYETAGLKDTVFLAPGETVRTLAWYGPWNGLYMFHCHNLIHEDHLMMAAINVTLLEDLGYDLKQTQKFADPMDPRFKGRDYSDEAYQEDAIHSTLSYLGHLNAYNSAAKVVAAESMHYSTAGYPTMSVDPVTVPPPTTSETLPTGGPPGRRAAAAPPEVTQRWVA